MINNELAPLGEVVIKKTDRKAKLLQKEIQVAWRFSDEIKEAALEAAKLEPKNFMDAVHRYSLYRDTAMPDPDPGAERLAKQMVDIYNLCSRASATCAVSDKGISFYCLEPHVINHESYVLAHRLGSIRATLCFAWDVKSSTSQEARAALAEAYVQTVLRVVALSLQFFAELLGEDPLGLVELNG